MSLSIFLPENLTERQIKKLYNYYRGYSFHLVRNRTIITLLVHTDVKPKDLIIITDAEAKRFDNLSIKRQLKKYLHVRRIYFDSEEYGCLFLADDKKPMSEKEISRILYRALRFTKVPLDQSES